VLDGWWCLTKEVFITHEASRRYNNERHFDSRTPIQVRRIENCVSCVGYPDGQAIVPDSKSDVHRDVTVVQQ
jgi:hypothetical protein